MTIDLRTIWNGIYPLLPELDSKIADDIKAVVFSELGKYDFAPKNKNTEIVEFQEENIAYKMFFLSKKVEGLSDRSLKAYKWTIDNFLGRIQKPINQVTSDDIRFYLAIRKTQDKVSDVTVGNDLRNLSAFFVWIHSEGYISKNPAKSIKKVRVKKKKKKAFTDVEIAKLRDACAVHGKSARETERSLRGIALIEFMLSTGCRVGEIAELKRDSIDFDTKSIVVFGKGAKERTVYMNDVAKLRLTEYWDFIGESEYAFTKSGNYKNGKVPLKISGIEIFIRNLGKQAGVENTHPHRFRRTCATNALRKGMSILDVQKLLGHESIDTTRIYLDLDDADLRYQHNKFF